MSYQWFHKPENALKRANELISMPNTDPAVIRRSKTSALEILLDTLSSKRNSKTWQQVHEDIIQLFLRISIELQLGRVAKDGLHQYRNLALNQNPVSFEFVITSFIAAAEAKAQEARRYANEVSLAFELGNIDSGDNQDEGMSNENPEALLLSTTTADDHRDRATREHVVPWLRFLWETYRMVLELIRYNSKLEKLYAQVSLKAFNFCKEFQRKIEFRRCCEILRNHLVVIQKHATNPTTQSTRQLRGWEGWSADSIDMQLSIRFEQLKMATELEHWTEGFRTIEDIHAVMNLSDKAPRVSLMATYYEKLIQIFWVSENYLFHAYAWYKFYLLSKNHNTKLTKAELTEMATCVLLAALSVPILDFKKSGVAKNTSLPTKSHPQLSASDAAMAAMISSGNVFSFDVQKDKMQRMAELMGFTSSPERRDLLDQIMAQDELFDLAVPEIQQLYVHLEKEEFHPLQVVAKTKPNFAFLAQHANPRLAQYLPALEKLLVQRLIAQLTQVYENVTLAHFQSLIAHFQFVSKSEVEQLIVRSVQRGHFDVRIDHQAECLHFGQVTLESQLMRNQLVTLGQRLSCVVAKLGKSSTATSRVPTQSIEQLKSQLSVDNSAYLERRSRIEVQKETMERLHLEKEQNDIRRQKEQDVARRELERSRLAAEARRREFEKRQKIKDEIQLKETKQKLERLGQDTEKLELRGLDAIGRDQLLTQAKDEAQRLKDDTMKRIKDQAKRLDYIVRATREAELPRLASAHKAEAVEAAKNFEFEWTANGVSHRQAWDHAKAEQARLKVAFGHRQEFEQHVISSRRERYEAQMETRREIQNLEMLEARVRRALKRKEVEDQEIAEAEAEEAEAEAARVREAQLEEARVLREQQEQEDAEAEKAKEQNSFSSFKPSATGYRPPVRKVTASEAGTEAADGEWTHVNRPGPSSSSQGPSRADEDRKWRRGPDTESNAPSGGSGGGGLSNAFGGRQEERRPTFGQRGDSSQRPLSGGRFSSSSNSYSRNDESSSSFSNRRTGGGGGGGLSNAFGGGDREGGRRFGAGRPSSGSRYTSPSRGGGAGAANGGEDRDNKFSRAFRSTRPGTASGSDDPPRRSTDERDGSQGSSSSWRR